MSSGLRWNLCKIGEQISCEILLTSHPRFTCGNSRHYYQQKMLRALAWKMACRTIYLWATYSRHFYSVNQFIEKWYFDVIWSWVECSVLKETVICLSITILLNFSLVGKWRLCFRLKVIQILTLWGPNFYSKHYGVGLILLLLFVNDVFGIFSKHLSNHAQLGILLLLVKNVFIVFYMNLHLLNQID